MDVIQTVEHEAHHYTVTPAKVVIEHTPATGDKGRIRKSFSRDRSVLPTTVKGVNDQLIENVLAYTGQLSYADKAKMLDRIAGRELGGAPAHAMPWKAIREGLMLHPKAFLKALRELGHLDLSISRLAQIEKHPDTLSAKELMAFSRVYNINLNQLK